MPQNLTATMPNLCLFRYGKKSFFFALALLVWLPGTGFAQQQPEKLTLTLDEAIQIALKNNYDLQMGIQDTKKADEQINEAYSNAYPSVSFSGQYLRNIQLPVMFIPPNSAFNPTSETQTFELGSKNSYSATITVGQTIYNQKVNTAIKIADEYASYSRTALKATRQQIVLAVKKAFLNVLLMQELLSVSKKSFDLADANYKNVSALYKQGVSSEYDNIRAEVQRANVLPVLTQTENNLQISKNYLRTLLAIDANKELEIKGAFAFDEVPQAMLGEYSANALSNSPMVEQLRINESLLEKNLIIERSEYYPTLAAFGQYQWQTQDNSFSVSSYKWAESFAVGLQLSYNIFDGFKRGARIEQVKIDKDKVTFARKKLENDIVLEIDQAQRKMTEAKGRIDAQVKSVQQAEKAQAIAESRYKNGVGTQLEIIDTQTALQVARTNYSQAIYDYLSAKADWEYAVSKDYPVK
jgi:outer membrane protein TolC